MSDNVAIKEGARAYNFTTDKLRTAQQNSDEPVIWVPESTVQLGSLRASENGVYLARSEDLYGFNEIVVSVNGAATIGDRAVFPDDSGQLHEENLPHDIVIFRPPKKLVYSDGEKINLGGIVVMAMDADGNVWTNARYPDGRIPLGELRINPTHADSSQAIKKASSSLIPGGVAFGGGTIHATNPSKTRYDFLEGGSAGCFANAWVITAAGSPFVYREGEYWGGQERNVQTGNAGGYTYDGKTVYFCALSGGFWSVWDLNVPKNTISGASFHAIAWTMIYGTITDRMQEITVFWPRYGDGQLLSTSYDITVTADDGFSGGSGKF